MTSLGGASDMPHNSDKQDKSKKGQGEKDRNKGNRRKERGKEFKNLFRSQTNE